MKAMEPTDVTQNANNLITTEAIDSLGGKKNTDNTDVNDVTDGIHGVGSTDYMDCKDTTDTTDVRDTTDSMDRISRTRYTKITPASLLDHWSRLDCLYGYAILRREAATEPLVPSILKKIVVSFCAAVRRARKTLALKKYRLLSPRPTDVKITTSVSFCKSAGQRGNGCWEFTHARPGGYVYVSKS